jgi:hypothetical protein
MYQVGTVQHFSVCPQGKKWATDMWARSRIRLGWRPVWQGVYIDSLKFHPNLLCPTLLRPAGVPSPNRPYGCFWDGLPVERLACGCLLPPWIPHVKWHIVFDVFSSEYCHFENVTSKSEKGQIMTKLPCGTLNCNARTSDTFWSTMLLFQMTSLGAML